MKRILVFMLSLLPEFILGQNVNKLYILAHIKPELTIHLNNYTIDRSEANYDITFNFGAVGSIQKELTDKLFIEGGLGYINRKLETKVFLSQSSLPPPKQSFTLELVTTYSISFRTITFPLLIGYRFTNNDKVNFFISTGITGNYLLSTYYEVNVPKYEGAYDKNCLQGFGIILGSGIDFKIFRETSATARVSYSVINTIKKDPYLMSNGENNISIPYKVLDITLGIKIPWYR